MLNKDTIQLYKRLLSYILPFKRMIAITLFSLLVIAAMGPAIAMILKELVDESMIAQNPDTFVILPLLLAGVVIIKSFAEYFGKVYSQLIAQSAVLAIRADMYLKMQYLPYALFQEYGTSKLLSKITYNVPQASNALSNAWVTIIRDSLTVLALVLYLLYLSWELTLMLLLIGPIVAFITSRASKLMRSSSKAVQSNMGELTQRLNEGLGAHQDIKVYGAELYEHNRFQKTAVELLKNSMHVTKVSALNTPLIQVIAALALAAIVYVAMQMSAQDMLTPGELLAYVTAMALTFSPIKRLTSINEVIQSGMAASETIFALLDQPNELDEGNIKIESLKGDLHFNNVHFTYPNSDHPALQDFNLSIPAGLTTALVGQSGSGKSTLVNLIARFYDPTAGEILLDGVDIKSLDRAFLRKNIALVSQKVTLFDDTVAANIAYGKVDVNRDEIIAAAKAAHAWEFIEQLPNGLDTNIGQNGELLSGGQRQRIAIARAFLKNAPILIFDEATSALDNQSEQMIQQAMEVLKQNRTVIVIAHRLSTIENANKIVVMQNGRPIEQGSHQALLEQKGLYAQLYNQGQALDE